MFSIIKVCLCYLLFLSVGNLFANEQNWKEDWSLADGFRIEIDSVGYNYPSKITFVEYPDDDPKAPLYFVLELKGQLKVVSNDRTIYTFAEDILPIPLSGKFDQIGAAGICLAPKHGYVFVTFAYIDAVGQYRNGMVRFHSKPHHFWHKAESKKEFLELFKHEKTDPPHQIGPCEIRGEQLFVAVGYGIQRFQAQNIDSTSGSILRMDLDFKPYKDNPFYTADGSDTAIDFIWAYGVRNVFGLKFVGNRLFASENGGSIDRFNEIRKGENYLWDGTDWGIAARAAYIFSPSVGLVQLDYLPGDSELFPKAYRNKFYIPLAGNPGATGPGIQGQRSVVYLSYDFEENRVNEVPGHLLKWRGKGAQSPVSVAFGVDGLYVIPILPDEKGTSSVLKISYDPDVGHPHGFIDRTDPILIVSNYQCIQCHRINGKGGQLGPELNETLFTKIEQRLHSEEYEARVLELDALEKDPFKKYKPMRQTIINTLGQERMFLWLKTYLQEPKFDNQKNMMPNPDMSEREAEIVATHLLQAKMKKEDRPPTIHDHIRLTMARWTPELRYRHVLIAFVLGSFLSFFVLLLMLLAYRFFKRKQRDL